MGDPLRTRPFSFLAFSTLFARTERHARVGRLCDDGRRRRARSWGTHREPGWFLCGLLQSICSNGTTCPRGKMLRRRAPSQGTFMGDPSRTRPFSFLAFFNPFWPSSVHCLEQSKRRRGTTLRRSSPPTCSGLRASGLGREIIAVSGPHYVRHTFGSGSESLRLGSNCLRRTHIVETEPGAVRIDRADIAPRVRQRASERVRQRASEHRAYGACGVPFTRKTDVILVGLARAVRSDDGRKKTRCVNLRTIAGYALSILVESARQC